MCIRICPSGEEHIADNPNDPLISVGFGPHREPINEAVLTNS
jgi:hypothetical protein